MWDIEPTHVFRALNSDAYFKNRLTVLENTEEFSLSDHMVSLSPSYKRDIEIMHSSQFYIIFHMLYNYIIL